MCSLTPNSCLTHVACMPFFFFFFLHTVKLNCGRVVSGVLRGFDPYMNIVLDDAMEERTNTEKFSIGMVVSVLSNLCCVVAL